MYGSTCDHHICITHICTVTKMAECQWLCNMGSASRVSSLTEHGCWHVVPQWCGCKINYGSAPRAGGCGNGSGNIIDVILPGLQAVR
jgi:hypothetical protein